MSDDKLPRFYSDERNGIWFVFDRTDKNYKAGPFYSPKSADDFISVMLEAIERIQRC